MEKENVSVIISGVEYIPKGTMTNNHENSDVKIVVLQRGWVMIGRFERDGSDCKLYNSYTIRRWGTSKGLGELAEKGRLNDTVLDKNNGIVEFDYLTAVATINCEVSAWEEIL